MKAVVHQSPKGLAELKITEVTEREAGMGEVKVSLKAAGLNHRDLLVQIWDRPTDDAVILGSDGAGIVEAVGEGVSKVKIGDEVIINPSLGWP